VLEIGSNDCTLLNYFKKKKCLTVGIEPAKNLFKFTKKNHQIINSYFNSRTNKILKKKYGTFDLILGNNVFAHIDNLKNMFTNIKNLMNDKSIIIFEVSYLLDVINKKLFDTIYHEHLDYHSISPLISFLEKIGLKTIDLEKVPIHGGSIRFYLALFHSPRKIYQNKINYYLKYEKNSGITTKKKLMNFYTQIEKQKESLKIFFENIKEKTIYGYGASAKAVTLINYFNLNHKHIKLIIDDSIIKQNKYIPGSKIKITNSKILNSKPPNYVIIFAWNVYKDIMDKLKNYKGIQYIVIPLPKFKIIKLP
jgi:SAM-dependent methyltransferase